MDLQDKREVRRRKILENSKNRLAKISGNIIDDSTPPPPHIIYPDPELEIEDPIRNSCVNNGMGTHNIFDVLNMQNATNHLNESLDSTTNSPKLKNFLQSKIHISILVILTYGLIVTEILPTNNVFLLFLLWELAEIFVLRTYEVKQTNILTILLLLAGIPHSTVILKWFELVNKVLRDVAIFVFCFVCVHIFWELLVVGTKLSIILDVFLSTNNQN